MTTVPLWKSLETSLRQGQAVVFSTVVHQRGSAPRPDGASLLVRSDGSLLGAVSAGCLETDVVRHSLRVLDTGQPELQGYRAVEADDPLGFGLSCGGSVDLAIERWGPELLPRLELLFEALAEDRPVVLATSLESPGQLAVRTTDQCEGDVSEAVRSQLLAIDLTESTAAAGQPWPAQAWLATSSDGERFVVRLHRPATPLWIFGATDSADALAALARPLGFCSTVVDARSHFATPERCPHADAVVCAWPHRWFAEQSVSTATVICALNHDPKFEIPLLTMALRSPAAYVGAMGSRSTHRQRLKSLQEAGLNGIELQRLRAPIGLNLGGRTAAEIALSILAEVVMLRSGGTGSTLTEGQGPLHRR